MSRAAIVAALTASVMLSQPPKTSFALDTPCAQYRPVAAAVGWPRVELDQLERICVRESKGFARAWNRADPCGGSYGIMQLNACNLSWLKAAGVVRHDMREMWNPRRCLKAALALWKRHGWAPWRGQSHTP